jgi:glycogen debranching enzyme
MTHVSADPMPSARAVLRRNDRGGYTVPADRLYPYQWNWDSAFAALGFATFDEARAWQEVTRLLDGQWDDGLVPHIVFHEASGDYFPGPEVWGTRRRIATSGITQPPVLASAVRRIHDRARDRALAEASVAAIYPRLLAWHRWWEEARDPERTGLVAILHPWESGMDNSPAWDDAMARVPRTTTTTIRRRDTGFVDAAQRPHQEEYERYIHLVDLYRDAKWDPAAMWRATPFKVTDVAINAILQRAEADLLALAAHYGSAADRDAIAARMAGRKRAFAALWNGVRRLYQPLDLVAGGRVDVAASSGFLPLYGGLAGAIEADAMIAEMRRWAERVTYAMPTVPADSPLFDSRRYWRGPVWPIVSWMLAIGLREAGVDDLAERLRADTLALIMRGGFAEYFDARNGDGLGAASVSWTAAIQLIWGGDSARD